MITGEDIDRLYEETYAEHLHETDSARSARRTAQMMQVMDQAEKDALEFAQKYGKQ